MCVRVVLTPPVCRVVCALTLSRWPLAGSQADSGPQRQDSDARPTRAIWTQCRSHPRRGHQYANHLDVRRTARAHRLLTCRSVFYRASEGVGAVSVVAGLVIVICASVAQLAAVPAVPPEERPTRSALVVVRLGAEARSVD